MAAAAGCASSHERPTATPASESVYEHQAESGPSPAVEVDTREPSEIRNESADVAHDGHHPSGAVSKGEATPRPVVVESHGPAPQPAPAAPVARPGSTNADNTGVNTRDRSDAALTPMDQSNSSADIDLVAKIRKAVVGDDGLSFNAKNVKIITNAGQVMLRGPVKNADEKSRIEAHARRLAGTGRVTSQLEIEK